MNWSMVLAALVAFSSAAHLPESLEHPQDDLLAMPSDSSVAALYRMPGMFGFKDGRPFYLEKDPVTGLVDFNTRKVDISQSDIYEDEDLIEGDGIDRKDSAISASDKNQSEDKPNKIYRGSVKYKPNLPLISSSYANTKIQGAGSDSTRATTTTTRSPSYYPVVRHRTTTSRPLITTTSTTTTKTTTTIPPTTTKLLSILSTTTTASTTAISPKHSTTLPSVEYEEYEDENYSYDHKEDKIKQEYEYEEEEEHKIKENMNSTYEKQNENNLNSFKEQTTSNKTIMLPNDSISLNSKDKIPTNDKKAEIVNADDEKNSSEENSKKPLRPTSMPSFLNNQPKITTKFDSTPAPFGMKQNQNPSISQYNTHESINNDFGLNSKTQNQSQLQFTNMHPPQDEMKDSYNSRPQNYKPNQNNYFGLNINDEVKTPDDEIKPPPLLDDFSSDSFKPIPETDYTPISDDSYPDGDSGLDSELRPPPEEIMKPSPEKFRPPPDSYSPDNIYRPIPDRPMPFSPSQKTKFNRLSTTTSERPFWEEFFSYDLPPKNSETDYYEDNDFEHEKNENTTSSVQNTKLPSTPEPTNLPTTKYVPPSTSTTTSTPFFPTIRSTTIKPTTSEPYTQINPVSTNTMAPVVVYGNSNIVTSMPLGTSYQYHTSTLTPNNNNVKQNAPDILQKPNISVKIPVRTTVSPYGSLAQEPFRPIFNPEENPLLSSDNLPEQQSLIASKPIINSPPKNNQKPTLKPPPYLEPNLDLAQSWDVPVQPASAFFQVSSQQDIEVSPSNPQFPNEKRWEASVIDAKIHVQDSSIPSTHHHEIPDANIKVKSHLKFPLETDSSTEKHETLMHLKPQRPNILQHLPIYKPEATIQFSSQNKHVQSDAIILNNHQNMFPNNPQNNNPSNLQNIHPNNHQNIHSNNPLNNHPSNPQNVHSNNPQNIHSNNPQNIHPNNQQNIHSNNPQIIHPNNPQNIHPNNPQNIHPNNPQNIHLNNPQNIHLNNPQNIHLNNPQTIHPNNPQNVHLNNPQYIHSNNPQNTQQSNLQNNQQTNPHYQQGEQDNIVKEDLPVIEEVPEPSLDLTPPQPYITPVRPNFYSNLPPIRSKVDSIPQGYQPQNFRNKPPSVAGRREDLPNILPHFRPNARVGSGPAISNGGIGPFFGPPSRQRYTPAPTGHLPRITRNDDSELLNFERQPPAPTQVHRRAGQQANVATLQMLQGHQVSRDEKSDRRPVYVVYPVNAAPVSSGEEDRIPEDGVVVGTRGAHRPLPPTILEKDELNFGQSSTEPLLKDRVDRPLLKSTSPPPVTSTLKNHLADFPYPLERPSSDEFAEYFKKESDTETEAEIYTSRPDIGDQADINVIPYLQDYMPSSFASKEKPISLDKEARIVVGKPTTSSSIPVTLQTVRPGLSPSSTVIRPDAEESEFTVSAIIQTHPQSEIIEEKISSPAPFTAELKLPQSTTVQAILNKPNHRVESVGPAQNFQAPFLASVTVGSGGSNSSPSIPGWSIISPDVNKKPEDKIDNEDASTQDATTQKGFDIENFKPQLFGGFKPLYSLPDNIADSDKMRITDREEKSLFK